MQFSHEPNPPKPPNNSCNKLIAIWSLFPEDIRHCCF